MKIRVLAFGLTCTFCLYGQKRFSWQDACFFHPAAPYCMGHELANKLGAKNTAGPPGTLSLGPSTVDAAGVDWRFAEPSADVVAVVNCGKLVASPHAHSLIDRLAASQHLSPADAQNLFQELSSVDRVALSVRENRIVLMVTGRATGSVLPAPEAGWKSVALEGKALLIGPADDVDRAARRISITGPLGELASLAQQRPVDSEFWAAGSAQMGGPEAATLGVKRFSLTATITDRLTSQTDYEMNVVPDANALKAWLSTLGDAKIEGNIVHASTSVSIDETRSSFVSPLGQRLGAFLKSARNLPMRDTTTTVHTKPVIYGLEEGAREVKAYVPEAAPVSEHAAPPQSRPNYTWVIQSTALATTPAKYNSYYYEPATDRSVEKPLNLPAGAAIVGVFPDDCMFSARNESGDSLTFRSESEAKATRLGPGTWSISPLKCSGVAVFLK